jgi:hypothetical protein
VAVDTVLATCVIIMMRDVISASDWSENFEYAIRLVSKRGGPQAVLSSDPTNFTRRFLLENLTTHDIFSESEFAHPSPVPPINPSEVILLSLHLLTSPYQFRPSTSAHRLLHNPKRTRPHGQVRPLVVLLHRDIVPFVGVGERREDVWDLEGDGGFYR